MFNVLYCSVGYRCVSLNRDQKSIFVEERTNMVDCSSLSQEVGSFFKAHSHFTWSAWRPLTQDAVWQVKR